MRRPSTPALPRQPLWNGKVDGITGPAPTFGATGSAPGPLALDAAQPYRTALQAIEALLTTAPDLAQVACFDTAFHHTLPDVEKMLPLPYSAWERGGGEADQRRMDRRPCRAPPGAAPC